MGATYSAPSDLAFPLRGTLSPQLTPGLTSRSQWTLSRWRAGWPFADKSPACIHTGTVSEAGCS